MEIDPHNVLAAGDSLVKEIKSYNKFVVEAKNTNNTYLNIMKELKEQDDPNSALSTFSLENLLKLIDKDHDQIRKRDLANTLPSLAIENYLLKLQEHMEDIIEIDPNLSKEALEAFLYKLEQETNKIDTCSTQRLEDFLSQIQGYFTPNTSNSDLLELLLDFKKTCKELKRIFISIADETDMEKGYKMRVFDGLNNLINMIEEASNDKSKIRT